MEPGKYSSRHTTKEDAWPVSAYVKHKCEKILAVYETIADNLYEFDRTNICDDIYIL